MYKNLYDFLVFVKNYSEFEAEETCLRFENGMFIPKDIKLDIKDFYKQL